MVLSPPVPFFLSAAALSVAGLRGEGSGRAVLSLDDVRGRLPPTNPVDRAPREINSAQTGAGELPNQCRGARAHHSPQLSAVCCLEAACRRPGSGCCPCAASPPLQRFGAAPGSCKYSPTAPRCCQKACRSAACNIRSRVHLVVHRNDAIPRVVTHHLTLYSNVAASPFFAFAFAASLALSGRLSRMRSTSKYS